MKAVVRVLGRGPAQLVKLRCPRVPADVLGDAPSFKSPLPVGLALVALTVTPQVGVFIDGRRHLAGASNSGSDASLVQRRLFCTD